MPRLVDDAQQKKTWEVPTSYTAHLNVHKRMGYILQQDVHTNPMSLITRMSNPHMSTVKIPIECIVQVP